MSYDILRVGKEVSNMVTDPKYGTIHLRMAGGIIACHRVDISDLSQSEYSSDESFVTCLSCRAISKWLEENNWPSEVPTEVVERHKSLGDGVRINLGSFWSSPATIKDDITWEGMAVYGAREDRPIP
jgi:hypothetical protein